MYADFKMADGAAQTLECTADSTWDGHNVYGILLTNALPHIGRRADVPSLCTVVERGERSPGPYASLPMAWAPSL